MLHILEHTLSHTIEDSVKLLPFLFFTYLLMELLEHTTGGKVQNKIKNAGKVGPLWGGLLGIMPQCGFSAAASSLYAGRVITVGTLLAVFLSTSDEMLPIFISEAVAPATIVKILAAKVCIAIISGFLAELVYVNVFKKNDKRTIYNVVYRDGKYGASYVKRFNVTGVTRDKVYNLTKGTAGSRILHFSANPNGEAEVIKVCLKPKPSIKKLVFEYDFAALSIKGRDSQGNTLTKNDVHKISVVQKGVSTLGGCKIWLDEDVLRLNTDSRGKYLGEFQGEDRILVVNKNGTYHTTDFDLNNHYDEGYIVFEKFEADKVWSAVFFDAEQNYYYLKRFRFEDCVKLNSIIGEVEGSRLICLSDERHPRFEVIFGGKYEARPADVIVADEFIGEKSFKARGKRITTFEVNEIREIEPLLKEGEADEINTDIEFEVTNPEEIAGDEQMKLDFENTDNPDEI